jgi:hypothetical protein
MSITTPMILIVVAVVVAAVLVYRNTKRREAERAEEYRKAAMMRGWQLAFDGIEYRYSGTTEGIPWTIRVGHRRDRDRTPAPMRWETTAVRMEDGVMIVWPGFGQGPDLFTQKPGVPGFALDLAMRPVAQALGVPPGHAALLADATESAEAPRGFLFRGTHADRLREWAKNGAAKALADEADWLANRDKPQHLILAVLWRHGLQMATPYGSNDFEQMERVARVGARLGKAF